MTISLAHQIAAVRYQTQVFAGTLSKAGQDGAIAAKARAHLVALQAALATLEDIDAVNKEHGR